MANKWKIPYWLEVKVRERDVVFVYCGNEFTQSEGAARSQSSWEHVINDASIITEDNIALCCRGCNASKGQRRVSDWLESPYCKIRGVSLETVAPVIKNAIKKGQ
ncbi:MAG: hypothetical protein P8P56_10945 [Yoonia sp.]|nr:hypothetical protein [Yoonia sp.]